MDGRDTYSYVLILLQMENHEILAGIRVGNMLLRGYWLNVK